MPTTENVQPAPDFFYISVFTKNATGDTQVAVSGAE